MRILKNRGDIYFSKSNKKKSNEQKILIIALVVIVVFTVLFLTALAIKYDFSAKKFFAPDNLEEVIVTQEEEQIVLPQVSGKRNFVSLVCKEDNLLFVMLVQVDMDNVSYKVSTLKAETVVDGTSLMQAYKGGGSANVKKAVESLVGEDFDYYIEMQSDKFAEFFNELGEVNYPVATDIRYKSEGKAVNYSLKIKAGEQRLSATQVISLVRYYLDNGNVSASNDLMLNCMQMQLNSKNHENKEELFAKFIACSSTNITVKDFSMADDNLVVLTNDELSVGLYSAIAEYDGNKITNDSLQRLKGYFVK